MEGMGGGMLRGGVVLLVRENLNMRRKKGGMTVVKF